VQVREAPLQDAHDIAYRGAARRSNQSHALRQHGKRFFPPGIKQALSVEALFQLLEGELQSAQADRLHVFDIKLVLTARFVDADGAAHGHMQAVFGTKFQARQLRAKTDATHLRVIVLEREVEVAGLRCVRVGDLALDENVGELASEQIADARGEIAYRPDRATRHERKLKGFCHGC